MSESEANAAPVPATSKKRSRAISSLTKEQIQHKRDVDRRAQRAFRQRTKDCIVTLEQKYASLQEANRVKEEHWQMELRSLRDKNEALLRCLRNVVDLTSVHLHEQQENVDANVGQDDGSSLQREPSPIIDPVSQMQRVQQDQPVMVETQVSNVQCISSTNEAITTTSSSQRPYIHVSGQATAIPSLEQSTSLSAEIRPENGQAMHHHVSVQDHGSGRRDDSSTNAGRLHTDDDDDNVTAADSFQAVTHSIHMEQQGPLGVASVSLTSLGTEISRPLGPMGSKMICMVLPAHLPATCPLDSILLNFLSTRREMLSNGVDMQEVVGPSKLTAKSFVSPERAPPVHGISRVMSEILLTFPHVRLSEKLAFFYVMHKTMRWQICNSRENYLAMPTWLRPTATQIAVPHAAWLDNIPWPGVRDILIEEAEEYPFELFSEYYSQNVTVNWQFDYLDAISDVDGDATLHSIFEKHICNLHNWTVSAEFKARFPNMVPSIYFRD